MQLRIRLDEELHAQIEESARKRGVSVNRELSERLTGSFAREVLEQPRGPVGGLLELVAVVAHVAGRAATFYSSLGADNSAEWVDDAHAYEQALRAAVRVLEALRPAGEATPPGPPKNVGTGVADGILTEVGTGKPRTRDSAQRTETLRRNLGPTLVKRAEAEAARLEAAWREVFEAIESEDSKSQRGKSS
jgi:hypothetical protein